LPGSTQCSGQPGKKQFREDEAAFERFETHGERPEKRYMKVGGNLSVPHSDDAHVSIVIEIIPLARITR